MSFKDILKDMRAVPPVAATTPIHRVERGLACAMEYPRPDKRGDRDALRRIGPDHSAYYDQLIERLSGADLQPGEFEGRMGMVATIGLSQWYYPQLHGARLLNIATTPLERTREAAGHRLANVAEYKGFTGNTRVDATDALSIGIWAASLSWGAKDDEKAVEWLLKGHSGYLPNRAMTPRDYMNQGLRGMTRLETPTLDQQIGIEIPASE